MEKHRFFREQALQHYLHARSQHVLPQFISPPVFLFLWILLLLAGCGSMLIGLMQIPRYAQGVGIISGKADDWHATTTTAIILLPPEQEAAIKPGQPVQMQIISSSHFIEGRVSTVASDVLSPQRVLETYGLKEIANSSGLMLRIITQPSILATVRLNEPLLLERYAGSIGGAKVCIGTQSIIGTW